MKIRKYEIRNNVGQVLDRGKYDTVYIYGCNRLWIADSSNIIYISLLFDDYEIKKEINDEGNLDLIIMKNKEGVKN